MHRGNSIKVLVLLALFPVMMSGPVLGHGIEAEHRRHVDATSKESAGSAADVRLLDLELRDRNGRPLRFKSDAVGDKIVVMDFVYTVCTTLCPVLSQVMSQVQDILGERLKGDVRLLSISVDPGTDTPARMKKHAGNFGAGPSWLWLTGHKPEVNQVLDALGAYTPDFKEHPGMVLVGDGRNGNWTRFNGFPSPEQIVAKVDELAAARRRMRPKSSAAVAATTGDKAASIEDKARRYFTDLLVVTHNGKKQRFFTDLLKDKVVLLTLFYVNCTGACPLVNRMLSNLQDLVGDQMGRDVFFISVTLDPENDTPEVLRDYAENFKPRDGWVFVTGSRENIKTITARLGQVGDNLAGHMAYLMVGDVKRAFWKKFRPNVSEESLAGFLRRLRDKG